VLRNFIIENYQDVKCVLSDICRIENYLTKKLIKFIKVEENSYVRIIFENFEEKFLEKRMKFFMKNPEALDVPNIEVYMSVDFVNEIIQEVDKNKIKETFAYLNNL